MILVQSGIMGDIQNETEIILTLKTGDRIAIEDADKLHNSVQSFYKKWSTEKSIAMATWTFKTQGSVIEVSKGLNSHAIEKQTGELVKLKYHGTHWKPFENKRLIGIVTEILKEGHGDFDVIKIREQTGGVRYFRRYILENA